MEKSNDLSFFEGILVFMGIILVFPFLIILLVCFLVFQGVAKIRKKIKLYKILKDKDGEVLLLYSNYNEFDFSKVLNSRGVNVECFLVEESVYNNVLLSHLCKGFNTKAYPRLVKVNGKEVISKEHYNSFKYYVKRNDDMGSFVSLLIKSINNLKDENSRIKTKSISIINKQD